MPKNKPKKHFLVAADERSDFFRAYTENKARQVAARHGADIYKIQGPLSSEYMKWHISAMTNYELLHYALPRSDAMMMEYAGLTAKRIVGEPEKAAELFDNVRELEKEIRIANLSYDAEDGYIESFGESFEEKLTLADLRELPDDAYRSSPNSFYSVDVDTVYAFAVKLEEIESILSRASEAPDQDAVLGAVQYKLCNIDARSLIRAGDEMGIVYGDRDYDPDFDQFHGDRDYGDVFYDVRDAVMRHWTDMHIRANNQGDLMKTFAFAVGRKGTAAQAVYVLGAFVREHGQKLEL